MKLSKILALFSWLNVFGLCWVMMYGPPAEDRGFVALGLCLFVVLAVVNSAIQSGSKDAQ